MEKLLVIFEAPLDSDPVYYFESVEDAEKYINEYFCLTDDEKKAIMDYLKSTDGMDDGIEDFEWKVIAVRYYKNKYARKEE
jgi:hypothetical protein